MSRIKTIGSQYNEENKEHRKQQILKPFECPFCNCWIKWGGRSIHSKTAKHQKAMTGAES